MQHFYYLGILIGHFFLNFQDKVPAPKQHSE